MEDIIKAHIQKQGGAISFRNFMELCLYHPEAGYYQRASEKTGKGGDFYTSPNVSSVFGEVIANYIYKMWIELGSPNPFQIVEFGAGKGQLAEAIITKLAKGSFDLNNLNYIIIDASKSFQQEQKQRLDSFPVTWLDSIEELTKPIEGCILSNELIDAFPVHWVRYEDNVLLEKFVGYDALKQEFTILHKPAAKELCDYFQEQQVQFTSGQEAEVNLEAKKWLEQCANELRRGYLLTIDYGYLRDELYAPHRKCGTLLCYRKHRVNENPLQFVGEQDITSHVNFSQLIDWGEHLGLDTIQFFNQQEFLMQGGIMAYLQAITTSNPFDPLFKKNAAIKQLLMPGGMGDTFKVLIQGKGAPSNLKIDIPYVK
ncbi:class I SAM-dependent methyltransferase [Desulfuribacillus alkaliarsenatis]|uniref:class I SAM-dependent methyltransferase n=1 Tax=Desulfuribacillus alkaliarsenatis TaxID=766136 RepID=UPI0009FE6D64|nr:SAM-dependent methyltransferase [Desulfuribacillus alkaliarsenatis]